MTFVVGPAGTQVVYFDSGGDDAAIIKRSKRQSLPGVMLVRTVYVPATDGPLYGDVKMGFPDGAWYAADSVTTINPLADICRVDQRVV